MAYEYIYRIVKEDFNTGERGKRTRTITRYKALEVGGLYMHLGDGLKGCWRVLELVNKQLLED